MRPERKASPVHKVCLVLMVRLVLRDHRVFKVRRAIPVYRDHKDRKDRKEYRAIRVQRVLREFKALPVRRDRVDRSGSLGTALPALLPEAWRETCISISILATFTGSSDGLDTGRTPLVSRNFCLDQLRGTGGRHWGERDSTIGYCPT